MGFFVKAIILAAGMRTRLKSTIRDEPKKNLEDAH